MPPRRRALSVLAASGLAFSLAVSAGAASGAPPRPNPLLGAARQQAHHHVSPSLQAAQDSQAPADTEQGRSEKGDALEVADRAEQYTQERTAPGDSVSASALVAARQAAARMPAARTSVSEVTRKQYDAEPAGYTDPYWGNEGSGFGVVSGRETALASDGNTYYAGAADGGVWKSTNAGRTWRSIWDRSASLSIGALLRTSDHALWVGTGEANTNSDSYRGIGVFRSTNRGRTFHRVGGAGLQNHQVYRLRADGAGHIYAATSQGLYRHSSHTYRGAWTLVLKPDPNPTGSPYATSMITDVAIRPGTHGRSVLAVLGWRNGSSYNGFYLSTSGGGNGSFERITPGGDVDATDIGRTTLAYSADGSRLYAIIQSPKELLAGGDTNLKGVYVSKTGDPAGPYTLIADSDKLDSSGSALKDMDGYHVGVQAWYNQALAVDPANPDHVYVSLEEVFQTNDGGATFTTASPYWNYGLSCGDSCPRTTHPDQHALDITKDRKVLIGNDGGVYSRPLSVVGYGHWSNKNATLHTLQYYDAAAGQAPGGLSYWGGLQDNGTSLLRPGASENVEPAGGDGGMVLVDPKNGDRAVGEYTDLAMYRTQDGGHSFTTISPLCGYYTDKAQCDPSARFIAPFQADVHDANHWVAAGNKVWDTPKGFDTQCATTCDWVAVHDFGKDAAGGYNVGTALALSGRTTYAAWVDSSGNASASFKSGIDTNYGGDWHRISSPALPNRYIAGLTVDPQDPSHVYAIYNGYSRRWVDGGGVGVVFESTDGGSTWRNVTGNLPDAPGDGLAIVGKHLVLATDVGVFTAPRTAPKHWSHVAGVPNASVNNVRPLAGSSDTALAATHGRGMWRVRIK